MAGLKVQNMWPRHIFERGQSWSSGQDMTDAGSHIENVASGTSLNDFALRHLRNSGQAGDKTIVTARLSRTANSGGTPTASRTLTAAERCSAEEC